MYKYVKLTNNTNDIVQIGKSATYTASDGTTTFHLSFPLKEMMFCDSTNGAVRLIWPEVSNISIYTSCKFYVKQTTNNIIKLIFSDITRQYITSMTDLITRIMSRQQLGRPVLLCYIIRHGRFF